MLKVESTVRFQRKLSRAAISREDRRYALVQYMVFMLVLLVFGFLVKFLFPIGLDYVGIYLESLHSYIARPSNTHPSLASCSWFCGLRYQISKQIRGSVLDFVDLYAL